MADAGRSGSNDTVAKGESYLEHYGVKGMKWGVVRAKATTLGRAGGSAVKGAYKPSKDAVEAQRAMARAKLGGVQNLDNREMQRVINRMNLERQYKELYGERQWHNAGKKWATKFANDVLRDVTTSWLSNPFARGGGQSGPVRAESWTTGQNFANAIENPRRAIGS